jgi:hypothetical protein
MGNVHLKWGQEAAVRHGEETRQRQGPRDPGA